MTKLGVFENLRHLGLLNGTILQDTDEVVSLANDSCLNFSKSDPADVIVPVDVADQHLEIAIRVGGRMREPARR